MTLNQANLIEQCEAELKGILDGCQYQSQCSYYAYNYIKLSEIPEEAFNHDWSKAMADYTNEYMAQRFPTKKR